MYQSNFFDLSFSNFKMNAITNDSNIDKDDSGNVDETQFLANFELDYDKQIDVLVEKVKNSLSKSNFISGGFYQFSMILVLSFAWGVGNLDLKLLLRNLK